MKVTFNLEEGSKVLDLTQIHDESALNEDDRVLVMKPVTWEVKEGIVTRVIEGIIALRPNPDGLKAQFNNDYRSDKEAIIYRINELTKSTDKKGISNDNQG